jgi:hypothetical protein
MAAIIPWMERCFAKIAAAATLGDTYRYLVTNQHATPQQGARTWES